MNLTTRLVLVAATMALGLTACGGGGGDGGNGTTNFNGLVTNLATTPTETGEPLQINGANFTFSEDPHAFDALFQ